MPKLLSSIKRFIGLSTEAKATVGVPNGSTFLETDTGSMYVFSKVLGTWSLKDEAGKKMRVETIKRFDDLLAETKKVNDNLTLVIEALDG